MMPARRTAVQFCRAIAMALAAIAALSPYSLAGQASPRFNGGVHAIGLVRTVEPARGGQSVRESYVTQPMLTGTVNLFDGGLTGQGVLNLEGLTLDDGELAPGNAGEGFIDRRHPHTYLHEAIIVGRLRATKVDGSIAAGRGFVPFGTDDPMVRPFVEYPSNHHWSQILERWVLIGAARTGPVTIEGGLFNGDEPSGPRDLGRVDRFADSWAARLTLRPVTSVEAQASYAFVDSPEHREGAGLDHRKYSASVRLERTARGVPLVALLEWAETDEYADGRKRFVFTTVLAETAVRPGGWRFALRFERTTRPEEERLLDPFRTTRPHNDENIVGVTRWNSVTAHAGGSFSVRGIALEPFTEIARSSVDEITGSIFDPREFYGDTRIWKLSLGLRINAGSRHVRMGRYGVALPGSSGSHTSH